MAHISTSSQALLPSSRVRLNDSLAMCIMIPAILSDGRAGHLAMYTADVIQSAAEKQLLGGTPDQEVPQQQRDSSCLAPGREPAGSHLHRRPLHAV